MPNNLNSSGLETATLAEQLNILTTAFQTIYGPTINVASDTPDGQALNIQVQVSQDNLDLLAQCFNSFNPDTAIGTVLDQRCAINGIQRQGGTYSQANVVVVTSSSVNLYGLDEPSNPTFTVSDNQGNQWELITTVLGSMGGTYAFEAAVPGAVTAAPNSLTIAVSVVLGVTSVNNPAANFNTGIVSETDAALRVRRQKSTSLPAQGYVQSLESALENINGISSAIVYENDGSTPANGIPGHSIWVIVNGTPTVALGVAYNPLTTYTYGQIASYVGVNYISVSTSNTGNTPPSAGFWNVYDPIAQAIYNYRAAGCGMTNLPTSTVYVITQYDGSSFTIYYDHVILVNPFIKISVGSISEQGLPNMAAIITAISTDLVPAVSAPININQVISIIQATDTNTFALFPTGYGISATDSGTYTYSLSPASLQDQFQIPTTNVILLPIALSFAGQLTSDWVFGANGVLTSVNAPGVPHGGTTLTFTAVGGYGTITFSKTGSGTIGSTTYNPATFSYTVTYTSGSAGSDTVVATDLLGNTMTASITVI